MRKLIIAIVIIIGLGVLVIAGGLLGAYDLPLVSAEAPTPTATRPIIPEQQVMAEGMIVPIRRAALQFSGSGVVTEILAAEGQQVQAGDIIAKLDGFEHTQAEIAAANLEVLSAEQALDDLYQYAELQKAEAELELARAELDYDDAQEAWEDANTIRGDQNQIDMTYDDLLQAYEDYMALKREYDNGYTQMKEDDEIRAQMLLKVDNARQHYESILATWNYYGSSADQLEVNQTKGELEIAKAKLDLAEVNSSRYQNGPDPDDLALAEARLKKANEYLQKKQAEQDELLIKAPFAGIIAENPLKIGEYAGPNSEPVRLADNSSWQIETTNLLEYDIVDIYPNMPVNIRIDALPDAEITGKVSSIRSMGETLQGDITYKIFVQMNEQEERLRWNMTAFVVFEEE